MTVVVLDASVVVKWFAAGGERNVAQAEALHCAWETGGLIVLAPELLQLEVLNVAARKWKFDAPRLAVVAGALTDLGFEACPVDLEVVARRAASGLTAYDAAYVAAADAAGVPLVTDDDRIVRLAPDIAVALSGSGSLLGG